MNTRLGLAATMVLLVLTGCAGQDDGPDDGQQTARPGDPVVPLATGYVQLAAAMNGLTPDGWDPPTVGSSSGLEVCPTVGEVPRVSLGLAVSSGAAGRAPDAPSTRPVDGLESVAILVPTGDGEPLEKHVRDLTRCDGTTQEGSRWSALVETIDGVSVTTVRQSGPQTGGGVAHRSSTIQIVDRMLLLCRATGTSEEATASASAECGRRGRDAVDVLRDGLPEVGTPASAAVIAGRLDDIEDGGMGRVPLPAATPCVGEAAAPVPGNSVTVRSGAVTGPGSPATVTVQPMESDRAAGSDLGRYAALVARCGTGQVVIPASDSTPEVVVTRTSASRTKTGGAGVRFESAVGTASDTPLAARHTEVFTLGAHVVFVSGEGKNPDVAAAHAEAATSLVLGG